ncbi:hypothetical protein HOLleu_22686 [Holothuria leucospilota]|uniref:Uncharacterized protein n=1 Tax=Holothuria leucospilota TaxID=206669 RepID=A0A9Q1BZJ7_HOLLE|nr:hypothetical protein HOLleu_22686 [Holothuria leucospilota]
MPCYLPSRSESEEPNTIKAHKDFMRKEKKKRQPDYKQVTFCMDKTLADRREWLVTTQPRPSLTEVQDRYPWLFDEYQVSCW